MLLVVKYYFVARLYSLEVRIQEISCSILIEVSANNSAQFCVCYFNLKAM